MFRALVTSFFLCLTIFAMAQTRRATVEVCVMDGGDKTPLYGAVVLLKSASSTLHGGTTNEQGRYLFKGVPIGTYVLRVTFVGYQPYEKKVEVRGDKSYSIVLAPRSEELEGLVVTAKETKGMTSASMIGQDAMKHLQPSSFTDLLELLPGGLSSAPMLTTPNAIRLREARIPIVGNYNLLPRVAQSKYATSSQGTAFIIDGIPIGTEASMQVIDGAWDPKHTSREFVDRGVDMRQLNTDDIESVEIIRGIPSVEYGNLTSGLVKIKRKNSMEKLEARFKADMGSKLFYAAKGVNNLLPGMNMVGSASLLNAYSDPRNIHESFKRLSLSLRSFYEGKYSYGTLRWMMNMDYTGSFDDEKDDPDLNYTRRDSFRSGYQRYAVGNSFIYDAGKSGLLSTLSWDVAFSLSREKMEVERFVQLSHDTPYIDIDEEGEHFGGYYPYSYTATHVVDGRPLYLYSKLKGSSIFTLGRSRHEVIWGASWDYSKNIGEGAIFDTAKPAFPNSSVRPRPFRDVPGKQILSFFLEDKATIPLGAHLISLLGGVVSKSLVGLESKYAMSNRFYTDLRANLRYSAAPINIEGQDLRLHLLVGAGTLSMFPSMIQLYPDKIYLDFVQLNYYHPNPDYRLVYINTQIYRPDNTQLLPARNVKYEVRMDAEYGDYDLSITFFRERMRDGFRPDVDRHIVNYKRYDATGIDHDALTAPPDINTIPYRKIRAHALLGHTTNGSETRKEGIEWMINTPRFPSLFTRVTFSGAWFRTVQKSSLPQYVKPSAILNNEEIKYVGLYTDNEELVSEVLNSDLRFDTYLQKLDMSYSVSFQCNWFSSAQKMPISAFPTHYYDLDGVKHVYTQAAVDNEPQLKWLERNITESLFRKYTIPFMMSVNLKATKHLLQRRLRLALFVNKIFDYSPDFKHNDVLIRRNQHPYFGMEINFEI